MSELSDKVKEELKEKRPAKFEFIPYTGSHRAERQIIHDAYGKRRLLAAAESSSTAASSVPPKEYREKYRKYHKD